MRVKENEKTAPRRMRRLAVVLTAVLAVVLSALLPLHSGRQELGGVYAAGLSQGEPRALLQGRLSEDGTQLIVRLSMSGAVFNVLEVGLEWDKQVLALSGMSDNQVVSDGGNGRISGRKLAEVIRLSEPSQTADQGGWVEPSGYQSATTASAERGTLRLHTAVSVSAACDGVYTPEGGGVYMDSQAGLDIAEISFRVLDRAGLENEANPALWLSEDGFLLAALEETGTEWNLWGYRDGSMVFIELLPGWEPVSQGDGAGYEPEWLSGSGEEPSGGDGDGSGSGSGDSGGIEIIDPPKQNGAGGNGGTTGSAGGAAGQTQGAGSEAAGAGGSGAASGATGAGGTAGSQTPSAFPDVTGHWARGSLETLAKAKLLSGYEDGTLRPDAGMTRAEFCVVAARLLGLTERQGAAVAFTDAKDHWAAGWIAAVNQTGIASGTGEGRFSPEQEITREELVVMAVRIMEKLEEQPGGETQGGADAAETPGGTGSAGALSFTDRSSISPWAEQAVGKGKAAGLVGGYEDGSFRPDRTVTRAEMSVIAERLLQRREDRETRPVEKGDVPAA